MINYDEHQKTNASLINFVDKHRELVDENWNMRKLLELDEHDSALMGHWRPAIYTGLNKGLNTIN